MKKLRIILPILMLVALLAGCSLPNQSGSKVSFYYGRNEFSFGTANSVIVSEKRDIAGHEGELQYILSLYLMGPLDEELTATFPTNTRIVRYTQGDRHLTIELTSLDDALTDSEFSLASSCLSMTCMELIHCSHVTLISGDRTITLQMSDLLLVDAPIPTEAQTEESQ